MKLWTLFCMGTQNSRQFSNRILAISGRFRVEDSHPILQNIWDIAGLDFVLVAAGRMDDHFLYLEFGYHMVCFGGLVVPICPGWRRCFQSQIMDLLVAVGRDGRSARWPTFFPLSWMWLPCSILLGWCLESLETSPVKFCWPWPGGRGRANGGDTA